MSTQGRSTQNKEVQMPRTTRGATMLVVLAASLLTLAVGQPASAQVTFGPTTAIDGTVPVPAVTISDVEVLGPSTARVTLTVDNRNLDSTLYLRYGDGTLLDQRTADVEVRAGASPDELIVDLLDLEPGSSYNLQGILGTPLGTATSTTVPFATPAEVFVNPATGAVTASATRRTRCTIVGTKGRDRLVGTAKRDVICGLGGRDRILGRGGNDLILAGTGNDRASGGNGRDRIYGNSGRDRLYGNKGRDRLFGGSGRDQMNTSSNHRRGDYISGGPGRDSASYNRGDRVRSVERRSRR
jgi:Ca2+-binding RTX toxin-like protein